MFAGELLLQRALPRQGLHGRRGSGHYAARLVDQERLPVPCHVTALDGLVHQHVRVELRSRRRAVFLGKEQRWHRVLVQTFLKLRFSGVLVVGDFELFFSSEESKNVIQRWF